MPRTKTTSVHDSTSLWEADDAEMSAHVDRRLATRAADLVEPSWFTALFDSSWPLAFAEAETWRA